jgi:pilus assembly protein CpaB
MKRRMITVLLFAFIAALVPSTIIYRAIQGRTPVHAAGPKVAVATRDLNVGALISDDDIRAVEWTGPVDPHWITHKADVVGRGVTANINSGEPIADNRLAPRGAGAGLAAIIPAGMRAVAVRVDEVIGVSGFVLPGMHVDVLTSGSPAGSLNTVTRMILQNVEVLSAGQNLERDAQGKPATVQVVNLLVTPADAEKLGLASGQMKVLLVLRNPLDTAQVNTRGVSTTGLLLDGTTDPAPKRQIVVVHEAPKPAPAPVVAPPPPPPPLTVEVIHGAKKEAVVVGHLN